MFTNDPLLRRMYEFTADLGSDPTLFLHRDAGPLAGHVALDRLDENGLGPEEVDVLLAASTESLALATAAMCAAASRGMGYDLAILRPDSSLDSAVPLSRKTVAVLALSSQELAGSDVPAAIAAAEAVLAGAVVFFGDTDGVQDRLDVDVFVAVPE